MNNIQFNKWNRDTFHIFEYYKNNKGIYIYLGVWIGNTVLFCANIFKKVIVIEYPIISSSLSIFFM